MITACITILTALIEFTFFKMKVQQRSQDQGESADDAQFMLWSIEGGKTRYKSRMNALKDVMSFPHNKSQNTLADERGPSMKALGKSECVLIHPSMAILPVTKKMFLLKFRSLVISRTLANNSV